LQRLKQSQKEALDLKKSYEEELAKVIKISIFNIQ
jgi:hypothetical protein